MFGYFSGTVHLLEQRSPEVAIFSHDQRVSYILSDAAMLFISRNERI